MRIIASCHAITLLSIVHHYRLCSNCLHIVSRRSCRYSLTLGAPQEELLAEAFQPFGHLQGIKLLRDKGGTRSECHYCSYVATCSACAPECKEALLSDACGDWRCCGRAVAYVKYDKASSAAAALESLHEAVLSDGRTKLKVMLAEAPNTRSASGCAALPCAECPPASCVRLFPRTEVAGSFRN